MNNFLKAMGQFGMEGFDGTETPMTELEEMNAEIAMEAELDDAYEQMDFANIVASTSQAEAMLTAMAEREVGLESNTGRDAANVYAEFGLEGFGMEAVKDVIARKAYSGMASIKALINTCISWLKQLIGIESAAKKVFSGLARKAKAMDKSLRKVAKNVSEEKLKRDMPDYVTSMTNILTEYNKANVSTEISGVDTLKSKEKDAHETAATEVKKNSDALNDASDDLNGKYDKNDTTEYEGSACYSKILAAVKAVQTKSESNKTTDAIKDVDKLIKAYEKLRKDISKPNIKESEVKSVDGLSKYITYQITYLTKLSNYKKKALKLYVKCADDCLTMAKGIYATLL